jgi:hypothetical protein
MSTLTIQPEAALYARLASRRHQRCNDAIRVRGRAPGREPIVVADEPAALHRVPITPNVYRVAQQLPDEPPVRFAGRGIAWHRTRWRADVVGYARPILCVRLRDVHGRAQHFLATDVELDVWLQSLRRDSRSIA